MPIQSPLGKLTTGAFLKRHWQKAPCVIREAVPDFAPPISAEELAGLACEEGVEARLVTKTRRRPGWSVRHGPFTEDNFARLSTRNWTLLVQDVDKYVPQIARLLDRFRFVPNWRIDDVMISYATDGGGVGPHADAYDVFLLQAQGFKRWSISTRPHANLEVPGLELKQVKDFHPQEEWLLAPGDMLYLPPGVAHDGVAMGESMTFSIGFRVPTDAEMLADLSGWLLQRMNEDSRYSDPALSDASNDPGLISASARRRLRQRMKGILTLKPDEFDQWFGRFITEPKPWLAFAPPRRRLDSSQMSALLKKSGLTRNPAALMSWAPGSGHRVHLFVNGQCYDLPDKLQQLVQYLARERDYSADALGHFSRSKAALQLLTDMFNSGAIRRG